MSKYFSKEQQQALHARRELGLDPLSPIEDIVNVLRNEEITVIKKKFESPISGLCSRHEDGTSAIMVNAAYSLGRQNFTLAHEYYHIKYDNELGKASKEKEKSANKFASHFLIPKEALNEVLYKREINKKNKVRIEDILYLSNYFKVSYLAILSRLRYEEKLITEDKLEELKNIDRHFYAKKYGYSTELYEPTSENKEISSNYLELANKAFENNKISIGKYEEILIEGGFEDVVYGLEENGGEAYDGKLEDYI